MTLRARFAICALLAASAGRAAAGCHDSAIHGWLDFWLGDWIVCEGRERAGTDRVTKVLDGCAVAEDWTGVDGSHGLSLFYVVLPDRTWRQVWITDAARRAGGWKEKRLVAHPAEGSVRFQGEIALEDDRRMLDRTTLRALADGSVAQRIEVSGDGGETWTATFDATYHRSADAACR